jgi:hypothetical protein
LSDFSLEFHKRLPSERDGAPQESFGLRSIFTNANRDQKDSEVRIKVATRAFLQQGEPDRF